MSVERTELSGWTVLRPPGRLDLHLGRELTRHVHDLCGGGSSQIVLDLTDVSDADASGVGTLVGCLRTARAHGGDFRLAVVDPDLRKALRLLRADRIFRLHDTVHEAIAAGDPAPRRLRTARRRRWPFRR